MFRAVTGGSNAALTVFLIVAAWRLVHGKRHPAVVVSSDGANTTAVRLGHGVVTVVPVTSSVERVYPFQVLVPAGDCGLVVDSKAQAEQVRSVTVDRVAERLGTVPVELIREVDEALCLHLGL